LRIVDQLKIAYDAWMLFQSDLIRSVRAHSEAAMSQNLASIQKITYQSSALKNIMAEAGIQKVDNTGDWWRWK